MADKDVETGEKLQREGVPPLLFFEITSMVISSPRGVHD